MTCYVNCWSCSLGPDCLPHAVDHSRRLPSLDSAAYFFVLLGSLTFAQLPRAFCLRLKLLIMLLDWCFHKPLHRPRFDLQSPWKAWCLVSRLLSQISFLFMWLSRSGRDLKKSDNGLRFSSQQIRHSRLLRKWSWSLNWLSCTMYVHCYQPALLHGRMSKILGVISFLPSTLHLGGYFCACYLLVTCIFKIYAVTRISLSKRVPSVRSALYPVRSRQCSCVCSLIILRESDWDRAQAGSANTDGGSIYGELDPSSTWS